MYRFLIFFISILTIFVVNLSAKALPMIKLPKPISHKLSVEQTLTKRRSIRSYKPDALTLQQVAQLLWAGQGITSAQGLRTAPSAGGLYPLEVYLVSGNVSELSAGVYHYLPHKHALSLLAKGDKREALKNAALKQASIADAPIDIVIAAIYQRTAIKYGDRAKRYVHMEAGHAAQNILLQAVSLDLGGVIVGAFYDSQVIHLLGLPRNNIPLYIIPIGKPL